MAEIAFQGTDVMLSTSRLRAVALNCNEYADLTIEKKENAKIMPTVVSQFLQSVSLLPISRQLEVRQLYTHHWNRAGEQFNVWEPTQSELTGEQT
jgi:hypothetical protein